MSYQSTDLIYSHFGYFVFISFSAGIVSQNKSLDTVIFCAYVEEIIFY